MLTRNPTIQPLAKLAMLLEQAAIGWGFLVSLAYWVGFALLLSQADRGRVADSFLTLPMGLPMIGLALGVFGLLVARVGGQSVGRAAAVALALNGAAMALAALLTFLLSSAA